MIITIYFVTNDDYKKIQRFLTLLYIKLNLKYTDLRAITLKMILLDRKFSITYKGSMHYNKYLKKVYIRVWFQKIFANDYASERKINVNKLQI